MLIIFSNRSSLMKFDSNPTSFWDASSGMQICVCGEMWVFIVTNKNAEESFVVMWCSIPYASMRTMTTPVTPPSTQSWRRATWCRPIVSVGAPQLQAASDPPTPSCPLHPPAPRAGAPRLRKMRPLWLSRGTGQLHVPSVYVRCVRVG